MRVEIVLRETAADGALAELPLGVERDDVPAAPIEAVESLAADRPRLRAEEGEIRRGPVRMVVVIPGTRERDRPDRRVAPPRLVMVRVLLRRPIVIRVVAEDRAARCPDWKQAVT